ncbi:uncharacterized protein LOC127103615 [Lathyrus oleraceus]|uniref:uncharacterized protein LOC127103615 n=1 Tax=Pisum sativum TaxID=3888 RepID=UPI0021CE27D6|nr:uncharacterized protein LOC127103615 [Pisum sativum]
MFNEPLSPTFSTTHNSLSYYDLTSNTKHSGSDYPDPTSLNFEDLQATTDSEKTPFVPEPSEPIPGPSKPELILPTFDEALAKFLESSTSRGVEEKLEARLAKETAEKAEREATEKAAKEATERATAEAVAKEKSEQEAVKVSQKAASNKATEVSLTQGELSTADLAHLVIKTLEELQKEQQLVRAILDKQDQVNTSIQSLLAELLQRIPPPPQP